MVALGKKASSDQSKSQWQKVTQCRLVDQSKTSKNQSILKGTFFLTQTRFEIQSTVNFCLYGSYFDNS